MTHPHVIEGPQEPSRALCAALHEGSPTWMLFMLHFGLPYPVAESNILEIKLNYVHANIFKSSCFAI